ncbi:hypothetical protein [Sphingomonas yabuuchiae]|uniref:hypothetical protein n=1 Tax=Sphingomonas yabuuchiae TaxID=172044 RepID=UPI003D951F74
MSSRFIYLALALLALPGLAVAQSKPVAAPGAFVPQSAMAYGGTGKTATPVTRETPLPVGTIEPVTLATGNVANAPVALYGGNYVLNQFCAGYGSVTLRYRAADGATMLPLLSRVAADAGGGTPLQFASGQTVDVALTGTTGCFVTLNRIP